MDNLSRLERVFEHAQESLTQMFFLEFRLSKKESTALAKLCVHEFAASMKHVLGETQNEG